MSNQRGKQLNKYVPDYVLYDLETTGISANYDEVIEISAVKVRGGKIIDEFSTLVNPGRTIPYGASAVNHIYDEMVSDAPEFEEVLPLFPAFIGNDILVGHNIASFDMKFLYRDFEKYMGLILPNDFVDTLRLAKIVFPDWKHRRLGDLANYYGISTVGAHRALTDCKMNQKVFELLGKELSGKKVDENGEGLGGALIGLFKSDDVEFTEENALMTVVSGDDGSFSFENVPYGSWYIREIKQPTGFVLDETVYDVNISENEQVVEIEIVNKLVRGNIALMKVDAEYTDTKLTGAVFEVYKDSNDNGELDSEDELIGTLTEKEIGQYEMNDLLYGRYFILESASPDSYIRDEGVYEVFIDTDGKTYQVENTEGKGFANEPMRGNLKIVKTSSDRKVEGFAFRITGENGYDVTLETDENGEIFLEGLRIGEYKISEVNNSASAMYILPADKEAAVQTGSTTVVEMHNELRDTPKTGDDSKLGLWLALAGVSAAGIAACGIIGFKKKKKKEDN